MKQNPTGVTEMEAVSTTDVSEMETLINGESVGQQVKQENQNLQETPTASPVNKKSNVKTAVVKPRTVKSTTDSSATVKQGTSGKASSPSKFAPSHTKPTGGTSKPTNDSSKTTSGAKRISVGIKTDSGASKPLTNGVPKRPAAPDRKLPPVSQSKTKPVSSAQMKEKSASSKLINGPSSTNETLDKKGDASTEKMEKVQSVKKSTNTTSTAKPKTSITAVKTSNSAMPKGTVGCTKPEKSLPNKSERSMGSAPSSSKLLGPSSSAAKTSSKPPAAVKVKKTTPVSSANSTPSGENNVSQTKKPPLTGQKEIVRTAAVSRKEVPSLESKMTASVKSAKRVPAKPGTQSTPTGQKTEANQSLQTTPNLKSPDKAKVRLQQSTVFKSPSQKEKGSSRPNTLPSKSAVQKLSPTSTKSEISVKAVPKKKLIVSAVQPNTAVVTQKEPEDRYGINAKESVVSESEKGTAKESVVSESEKGTELVSPKESEDVPPSLHVKVKAQEIVEPCKVEAPYVEQPVAEEITPVSTTRLSEKEVLEKAVPEVEAEKVMLYSHELTKEEVLPETCVISDMKKDELSESLVLPELEAEKVLLEAKQKENMLPDTEMLPVTEAEKEVLLATEAEVLPATEAEALLATEAEALPATEAEALLATEAEALPATEAEALLATEVEVLPATEVEVLPATEVEVLPATEVEVLPATEALLATEAELATEVEALLATEAEALPVTEVDADKEVMLSNTEKEETELPEKMLQENEDVMLQERENFYNVNELLCSEAYIHEQIREPHMFDQREDENVCIENFNEARAVEFQPHVENTAVAQSELPEKMLQENEDVMLQESENLYNVNKLLCSEVYIHDHMREPQMFDQKEGENVCTEDFNEARAVEFQPYVENIAVTQSVVQDSCENAEFSPRDKGTSLKDRATLDSEDQTLGMLHPADEREGLSEMHFSGEGTIRETVKESLCIETTPTEEHISGPCSEMLILQESEQKVKEPCCYGTEDEDLPRNLHLAEVEGSFFSTEQKFSDGVSVEQQLTSSPVDSSLPTSRVQTEAYSALPSEFEDKCLKGEEQVVKDEIPVDKFQQETSEQLEVIAPYSMGTKESECIKEESLLAETEELISESGEQNKDVLLRVQLADAEEPALLQYPPAVAENVDVLHVQEGNYEERTLSQQFELNDDKGCTLVFSEGVMDCVVPSEHSASEESSYFTMCSEDQVQESIIQMHGEQESLLQLADPRSDGKSSPCEEMEKMNDHESDTQLQVSANEVVVANVNMTAVRCTEMEEYFSDSPVNETGQAGKSHQEYAEPNQDFFQSACMEERNGSSVVVCESVMGRSVDYSKELTNVEETSISKVVNEMVCPSVNGGVFVGETCEMDPQRYVLQGDPGTTFEVKHSLHLEAIHETKNNVDDSEEPEKSFALFGSEADQMAMPTQYEQASYEGHDASETVTPDYEHSPTNSEMENTGLEQSLDEPAVHQYRESHNLSMDNLSISKPQTLPVQFESYSEQIVVPPPEHEKPSFADPETVCPEDQSPEKGPSHSSTLSGAELAGKSSSETSTPEELRDYDSSSGVESRSEEKLEYFVDLTDPQIKFSSPLDELPDQDLGIHMEKGDEAETIPADELLGDPPTEPTVSSEDDNSDADDKDLIKDSVLQGIDNPVFEEKSKQSSALEVEVCKSPEFQVEGSEDQAFSETPVSEEVETPVSDVECENPPFKEEADLRVLTCDIEVDSEVLSSGMEGIDLKAVPCGADRDNYEALPLKSVPSNIKDDFEALPSDAKEVECEALHLGEEEAESETLTSTAGVARASDAAGLDMQAVHFPSSLTSDLSFTCNIPVDAVESLSESDQVTPDVTSETTESDLRCSPRSDILTDHLDLHKLNEAESQMSNKWNQCMLLEESDNLVSDHFGSAGSKAGHLFEEDFSSPLRHVVAAAEDEELAQAFCSAACEKTDSEVPGNV